jgi:rare lipoprotein A
LRNLTLFALFDLDMVERDNSYMSDPTMKVAGELQGKKRRKLVRVSALALTLGLSASVVASPTVKRDSATAKGASTSKTAKRHWFQVGKASWYGPGFDGRSTANGEKFDMFAMTCAHRTLPLGSWVRVTNLLNSKAVFLRVNDRGPVAPSLIVDLSYAAAKKLGVGGTAKVKIEAVPTAEPKEATQLVAQLPMTHGSLVTMPELAYAPQFSRTSLVEIR